MYGQQSGFQPGGIGGGFISQQPTGFQGARPQQPFQQPQQTGFQQTFSGFQQPQQTGFPPTGPAFLQAQPTGFQGAGNFTPQSRLPPPPVPPIPAQFQQQPQSQLHQQTGFLNPQANRFGGPSPLGFGGSSGIAPQPTGFPGRAPAPLVPQVTGYVDPRLQMMSSSFMPANVSAPYGVGGNPQLSALPQQQLGGLSLQQSFQQHNQARGIGSAPKVPWALSKPEKKQYDQIFRSWDAQGTGFVSGQTALEVFGQSGLDKNDLARIWTLADNDNRGKLNLAEFHVAMGLIYRKLNGNDIPDQLPPELVPPSSRDLDTSVNFLKDILKNDTRSRSPSGHDTPVSRLRERSFNSTSAPGAGGRKDATVYKHTDAEPPGGFYQPRSRHIDRSTVRSRDEDNSPAADISDLKRQLANTQKMLDASAEADAGDDELDREMSELGYRIKRLQDDLEYVSRGPRSASKDEERRRLERELLQLMHERVPELERKIEDRQARKEREKREQARERDRRNERSGRFDDTEGRYSPLSRPRDGDRDRPYSRTGSRYDRDDRDYDRDRSYRDRDDDRDHGRDRNRGLLAASRTPPPPPPAAPANNISQPPPPPAPSRSPAPGTKNMTPEERKAFIQAEAKKRLEARMQALGVSAPSSTAPLTLDVSVEDRLAQEKKEAEEKAMEAERHTQDRERLRRERLENEKALKEGKATPQPMPTMPTPTTTAPPPAPAPKAAPPALKTRAPAPPPPRKGLALRPAATSPTVPTPTPSIPSPVRATVPPPAPVVPAPPPVPAEPEEDPEDAALKAREEALRKKREERAALLRKLEEEEEEARRAEEAYQARRKQFLTAKPATPPPAPPTPSFPAPPPPSVPVPALQAPEPEHEEATPNATAPPPPPPPPPPAPTAGTSADKSSTNPFSRMMKESGVSAASTPAVSTSGNSNPFFRSQTAPPPAALAPPKSPAPPAVKTTYNTAGGDSDDDWDDVKENEESDSSDEDLGSRDTRMGLAQQLFGSLLPSRPQSAGPGPQSPRSPGPHAPPPPVSAPPAPSAPSAPAAPPSPPSAPSAPPAPAAPPPPAGNVVAPTPTGDRSVLLSAIQSGARLRKAVTNDRSAAAISGKVIGDVSPPAHINTALRPASPPDPVSLMHSPIPESVPEAPSMSHGSTSGHSKRESVDWYKGLAADQGAVHHLPATIEEDEEAVEQKSVVPQIEVSEAMSELMEDIDQTTELRVRSLYPYEGQRLDDLSFVENVIITAHPSKSGADWWYGTVVKDGKSGFFPQTYVQVVERVKANAIYSYAGGNADELPFAEGDELSIIDRSEADWWKAERDGMVFIVPAAYLEIVEGAGFGPQVTKLDSERRERTGDVSQAHDDGEDSASSDVEEYFSMDNDSENEEDEGTRELERQRVFEAAGLIVDTSQSVMPGPPVKKRRAPPATPERVSIAPALTSKELPPVPLTELDSSVHLEDAFDRYETFKKTNGIFNNSNRMSVVSSSSFDTFPTSPSSPPRSPAVSLNPSINHRDGESRTSQFLNFLGRHATRSTTPEPDRRSLVISGPILNTPSHGGGDAGLNREDSPSFGTSWASLVDKSALEGIPKVERRRQEAIFELISTEADYVRDLQLIVRLFYSQLIGTLEEKASTVIFANIEDILLTNTTFLSVLEERQRDCRLYIDHIGDVLATHVPNMHLYLSYCVNQSNAAKVLQSLRDNDPALAAQLQRLRDDQSARNLDLSHYLLVPMQRLTRYPLLIRQILQYTDPPATTNSVTSANPPTISLQLPGDAEEQKNISAALDAAEKILDHVNETIREQEGRERLREISKDLWIGQGRLDLTAPTRYLGPRQLLKEGVMNKAKSGRKLRLFLCNDILVLTDEVGGGLYHVPIPLNEVQIKGPKTERENALLHLHVAHTRGGDTIVLRVVSIKESLAWKDAIERASRRAKEGERRAKARYITPRADL